MKLPGAIASIGTFCVAADAACPTMECPGLDPGSCAPIHVGAWCSYTCVRAGERLDCNDQCNNCEGKGTPAPAPKPTPTPKAMPPLSGTPPSPKPTALLS